MAARLTREVIIPIFASEMPQNDIKVAKKVPPESCPIVWTALSPTVKHTLLFFKSFLLSGNAIK
jgi:hypothetical protein